MVLDIYRLAEYGLKAHPEKCKLGTQEFRYLGHIITPQGNLPDDAKLRAISSIPPPEDISQLRAFLGLTSYYRRFVQHYAHIAAPLNRLLRKQVAYTWTEDCQAALQMLKDNLKNPPVLHRPDFNQPFTLQADYSQHGLRAVLSQRHQNRLHPVCFAARATTPPERHLSTTTGEATAVIWAVEHFRHYLLGNRFTLVTDHQALNWILTGSTAKTGKLARWWLIIKLLEFDFDVIFKPGLQMQMPMHFLGCTYRTTTPQKAVPAILQNLLSSQPIS